jgi:uncharacterized protein (TIGR00369 family)
MTLDPDIEARVRTSFARQSLMSTIGASLHTVARGAVVIALHPTAGLLQQHGYLHAGITTSIADSACGYAASTMMPRDSDVLSVEFKVNLLAPAAGDWFQARGRVVRSGRTLTVCQGDVFAITADGERHIATMLATLIAVA